MTREEALNELYIDDVQCPERLGMMDVDNARKIINKIFDSLEVKTPKDTRTLKEKKLDWGQMG